MRIYTDKLTEQDLYRVASRARDLHKQDIYVNDSLTGRSRKRARRLEVHCGSVSGRYATNSGQYGAAYTRAATWDAWGYFIAELFKRDPDAIVGQYNGLDDFRTQCERTIRSYADYAARFNTSRGRVFDSEHTGSFLEIVPSEAGA